MDGWMDGWRAGRGRGRHLAVRLLAAPDGDQPVCMIQFWFLLAFDRTAVHPELDEA